MKLVISDAHEGIKAAASRVFSATLKQCRVHFSRNAMARAGKSGRRVVSAFTATAYPVETPPLGDIRSSTIQIASRFKKNIKKATLLAAEGFMIQ